MSYKYWKSLKKFLASLLASQRLVSSPLAGANLKLLKSVHQQASKADLPIRYLGLPLCTKKLTIFNCDPLLQNVKTKMNTWSARTLSFAGRLQLLNSVISWITTFSFHPAKEMHWIVNSMSNAFLWKGNIEGHHSSRVAWTTVVLPKQEGGLGVRDLYQWNRASALKLIWMLFFKSGSVWVAWFINEILAGKLTNFWTRKKKQKLSWLANKLIKMRDTVYPWLKLCIGNGQSCRFWIDNWSPYGQLLTYLRSEGTQRLGIPLNTTLSSLLKDGSWNLPHARSEKQLMLQVYLSTLTITNTPDSYNWWIDDHCKDGDTTSTIYFAIRDHADLVPWFKVVWCSGGIKKHNFLTWLMVLNRYPTRDRILGWGLQKSPLCLLCGVEDESRGHLFFRCHFSWSLWSRFCQRSTLVPLPDCNLRTSNRRRKLQLIAWQASIYFLWTERNNMLHRQIYKSPALIFSQVGQIVRNRASSFRESHPSLAYDVLQMWFETDLPSWFRYRFPKP